MQIFLSYASEDRQPAEEIQLALVGSDHHVFFDRASLPAGGDYHARIQNAVRSADTFVFLISPHSVAKGSYALTELTYARAKWPHPKEKLLPVLLHATDWNAIPPYLKSVTVLEPEGNVAAEVLAALESLVRQCQQPIESAPSLAARDHIEAQERPNRKLGASHHVLIWVVTIALVGIFGGVLLVIWDRLSPPSKPEPTQVSSPPVRPGAQPPGAFVDRFVGRWVNENPDTSGITRVDIDSRLNNIYVRMWGKCHPTDCDWGAQSTSTGDSDDGILSITWTTGFAIEKQQLTVRPDGRLQVFGHTEFTDNSGRPNYDSTHYFVKK